MNEQINRLRALIALADAITDAQGVLTTAHIAARTELGGEFVEGYNSVVAAMAALRNEAFSKVRAESNAASASMDDAHAADFHTRVWKK